MQMKIEVFTPGQPMNAAGKALSDMLRDYGIGQSYADMMRLRISGKLADQCADTYFVAYEDGICYSRLWNGWGVHKDAIGNFGNFMTLEQCRGQGIGKKMLQTWYDNLQHREDKPLALFCSANDRVAGLYYNYGFRPATEGGHLYLPVGNSPDTFRQFCQMYYTPSDFLIVRPATIQYRHEIDCLLRFALLDTGMEFSIGDLKNVEQALLYYPGRLQMLFTENGRCVGWQADEIVRVHPQYKDSKIVKG